MTRTGSAGNDTLRGGNGNDVLEGRGGDDVLVGGGGNDRLDGGSGNDQLSGGAGADELEGGAGDDLLDGGAGADELKGGLGNDTLQGGNGADDLRGGQGDDVIDGGLGNDVLVGGAGNDTISGGDGTDRVVFTGLRSDYTFTRLDETRVTITDLRATGDGTDTLTLDIEEIRFADGVFQLADLVPPLDPVIRGTEGNDSLVGTEWSDEFAGGAGDDVISGSGGSDVIDGGDGVDTAVFTDTRADYQVIVGETAVLLVDLRDGNTSELRSIESVAFSDQTVAVGQLVSDLPQVINGTDADDVIDAGGGSDQVSAGAGDDVIVGGAGDDDMFGGDGNDTFVFSGNRSDYSVVLFGSDGVEITDLRPGAPDGRDFIVEGERFRFADGTFDRFGLVRDQANDLVGTEGDDHIDAGAGNDQVQAQGGNDTVLGGSGIDFLFGGSGDDTLFGGEGRDGLIGEDGDDVLVTDGGDSALQGGAGFDTLRLDVTERTFIELGPDAGIERVEMNGIGGTILGGGSDVALAIVGSTGSDYMYGSVFDDVLIAGGGMSYDYMRGGAGADRFVCGPQLGFDEIADFEIGVDKIDLSAVGVSFDELTISAVGGELFQDHGVSQGSAVYIAGRGSVLIAGIAPDQLGASDFIL